MSDTVIQIDDVSKRYRLGTIGGRRLVDDVNRRWARLRGKPDPLSPVVSEFAAEVETAEPDSIRETLWALKNVSFDVKQGEVLGVIGRNGAGKSTLLKILSRVTAPTSGEIRAKGRIASLLEVGTGFHPELTGRENIFLNGAILGMTRAEITTRFDEIVSFAEIERFIDTPVKRYSSGMYVRLAFAVAAHLQSEILVVDEVLAVGDAAFQEKCLGKMESVAGQGRTVIIVSHNMSTIQQLCTRCVLFKHGQLFSSGEPSAVVSDYLSETTLASDLDISNWKDRKTTGEAKLTRISMTDENGRPTASFPLGGTINFHLEARLFHPLVDPQFGLLIQGSSGESLLDIRSAHDGLRVGRIDEAVRVTARLTNIGLYPGRYFISPWITDAASGRDLDYSRLCGSFQVLPKPGKWGDLQLNPQHGKFFVQSEWSATGDLS